MGAPKLAYLSVLIGWLCVQPLCAAELESGSARVDPVLASKEVEINKQFEKALYDKDEKKALALAAQEKDIAIKFGRRCASDLLTSRCYAFFQQTDKAKPYWNKVMATPVDSPEIVDCKFTTLLQMKQFAAGLPPKSLVLQQYKQCCAFLAKIEKSHEDQALRGYWAIVHAMPILGCKAEAGEAEAKAKVFSEREFAKMQERSQLAYAQAENTAKEERKTLTPAEQQLNAKLDSIRQARQKAIALCHQPFGIKDAEKAKQAYAEALKLCEKEGISHDAIDERINGFNPDKQARDRAFRMSMGPNFPDRKAAQSAYDSAQGDLLSSTGTLLKQYGPLNLVEATRSDWPSNMSESQKREKDEKATALKIQIGKFAKVERELVHTYGLAQQSAAAGRFDEARQMLVKALPDAESLGQHYPMLATMLLEIALIDLDKGNFQTAESNFKRARQLILDHPDEYRASYHFNLGSHGSGGWGGSSNALAPQPEIETAAYVATLRKEGKTADADNVESDFYLSGERSIPMRLTGMSFSLSDGFGHNLPLALTRGGLAVASQQPIVPVIKFGRLPLPKMNDYAKQQLAATEEWTKDDAVNSKVSH